MYYKKYFTQFKSSYKTAKIKTTNVDIIQNRVVTYNI